MTSPVSSDGLQIQADEWLRDIVRRCARAYRHMSVYACAEAIREIDTLPVEIQVSPWALEITARAYYEMANYTIVRLLISSSKSKLISRPDGYLSVYLKSNLTDWNRSNITPPSYGIFPTLLPCLLFPNH